MDPPLAVSILSATQGMVVPNPGSTVAKQTGTLSRIFFSLAMAVFTLKTKTTAISMIKSLNQVCFFIERPPPNELIG